MGIALFAIVGFSLGCASSSQPAAVRNLHAQIKNFEDLKGVFGRNYEVDEMVYQGTLQEGEFQEWSLELSQGEPVAVVAACDDRCKDLDITIADGSDEIIVEDVEMDKYPHVTFVPETSTEHGIRISMARCEEEECDYAFQILYEPRDVFAEARGNLSVLTRDYIDDFDEQGIRADDSYEPEYALIRPDRERSYELDLEPGAAIAAVAACDGNCLDVDLLVRDSSGESIVSDILEDDEPFVFFHPPVSGKYEIVVRVPRCGAAACAFGLQIFEVSVTNSIIADASGTCFAVNPDGLLLTAHHVIDGAESLKVRLSDGRELPAVVDAYSANNDLATIRVASKTPSYLTLAPERSTDLGQRVFTVGYPIPASLGGPSFGEGTVNGLTGEEGEQNQMQHSIPIQPGNSGGPVVDEQGRVLGIVTASVAEELFFETYGTLPQSINWAVKADVARFMFDQPEPLPVVANRDEAIQRARQSVCYVEASSQQHAPASMHH